MHVVVVGCGRVGSGLAALLEGDGHTVAVIDRLATAFKRLPESFTGERLTGVGFDRDLLCRAGIERAGALAAVTNGDNSNILIARVAYETFGVERVVARIYDPNRARIYQRLGIPTVATSQWTIDQILRRVNPDKAVEWSDPSGHVSVVEVIVPTAIAGSTLDELGVSDFTRPVALTRFGASALAPLDLVLQEGDVVYLAVDNARMAEFDERMSARHGGGH